MKKIREFAYKHAIISSLLIALIYYGVLRGIGELFSLFPDSTLTSYVYYILALIYPFGFVAVFGFMSTLGNKNFFKALLCGMPKLALQAIILVVTVVTVVSNPETVFKPWYLIILGVIRVIGIGLKEELVFRATIQNVLTKRYAGTVKGIWIITVVSALIFGLIHAANVFVGVQPIPALVQSIVNVGMGLFYAALYLRTQNIWALVVIHALTDTAGLFEALFCYKTVTESISEISPGSLIYGVVFAAVAVFMLRPSKCKEILNRFNPPAIEKAE